MLKYQLGTASISEEPKVVVHFQQTHVELGHLLSSLPGLKALPREPVPSSLMEILADWSFWRVELPRVVDSAAEQLKAGKLEGQLDATSLIWLPPLLYPRKLICLGANYRDHLEEMGGGEIPPYPFSFFKPPTTALIGAGQNVRLPKQSQKVDWEAELAVVIGKKAYHVKGEEAMACVAGYSPFNDLSARDWLSQRSMLGVDLVMMKAYDGFSPMGPYITPAEFVPDPHNLKISLTVNGVVKQNSNTGKLIFGIRETIEHLSSIMTLEPGDVICTGTPAGAGAGKKPPEYLKAGDVVVVEIEGLGHLENTMM